MHHYQYMDFWCRMKEPVIRYAQIIKLREINLEKAQCLIKIALNNDHSFYNLVNNVNQLIELSKAFPKYSDNFIKKILKDTSLFEKIIVNAPQLIKLAKAFPKYKDTFIFKLLDNTPLFKKIVMNKAMLNKLNDAFHKYSNFFNKSKTNEAFNALNEYINEKKSIRINSILLSQARRQFSTCNIGTLPQELLIKIGIFNRNQSVLSKQHATQIFNQYFKIKYNR